MEHELLEKIQVEIEFEFMVLEFQKKKKNSKSTFAITRFLENRVSKQGHFLN